MLENSSSHGRLDSWKEIANYLNRDIRTAIRWEDKGMPVHRVPGGKRQAVFAYKEEINAWLISPNAPDPPSQLLYEPSVPHQDPGIASEERFSPRPEAETTLQLTRESRIVGFTYAQWRTVLAISAGLAVLMGIIGLLGARKSSFIRAFNQLTVDGRSKDTLRTDGRFLYFNEEDKGRSALASAPVNGRPIRLIETPFNNVRLQDLSRDGQRLLFTAFDGREPEGSLWTISVRGGTPRRVSDIACDVARWSPDNRMIACATGTKIFLLLGDNSSPRTVGSFPFNVIHLVWTPDGGRLLFVLDDFTAAISSAWELTIQQDGTASPAYKLPLPTNCCLDFSWMPDGKTFVYLTTDIEGRNRLMAETGWSVRDTELPVRLGDMTALAPGRDGKTLYVVVNATGRAEMMKFDGAQGLQPFLPSLQAEYIAYSRDGEWITYVDALHQSLWRSRADGSDALQLTQPPTQVEVSSWSPDGRHIAYMRRDPGKTWRIVIVDRDGGPSKEVSESTDFQGGPSWSLDGKTIVYGNVTCAEMQNCWIRRIDVASGKVEIIPGSHGFRTARWSPDGKYIAALNPQAHEVMLFNLSTQRWEILATSVHGDNVEWANDSQSVFVDNPDPEKWTIERIWIRDRSRINVLNLAALAKFPGSIGTWIGLTPDNSPMLLRRIGSSEVYILEWSDH